MQTLEITTLQYNMAFRAACAVVMRKCPNEYAKSYARAGLSLDSIGARQTQCLCILNNIQYWRGEDAKTVRGILKALSTASIMFN